MTKNGRRVKRSPGIGGQNALVISQDPKRGFYMENVVSKNMVEVTCSKQSGGVVCDFHSVKLPHLLQVADFVAMSVPDGKDWCNK